METTNDLRQGKTMKKKLVVIINGSGGVGKDSLCAAVEKAMPTINISSIDPIKDIATYAGWDGTKDDAGRLLLVELKQAFVRYNDLPLKFLCQQYEQFLKSENVVLFVHIREPEEIAKFKKCVKDAICKTILITRDTHKEWQNTSDSGVSNYDYDCYFENNRSLEESGAAFVGLIADILEKQE